MALQFIFKNAYLVNKLLGPKSYYVYKKFNGVKNAFTTYSVNEKSTITKSQVEQYNKNRLTGADKVFCYAPFNSLYFGNNGNVTACCYNRSYLLGSYPNNSINAIWFGDMANKLRQSITDYNLHDGCGMCQLQIDAGNYENVMAAQYDYSKAKKATYPTRIDFELSNTCNLECIMCNGDLSSSIRKNRENRPAMHEVYDDAFLEQLKEYIPHLKVANFLGGEPFLINIYYKIWELITNLNPNCIIRLQTNGTVLNEKVKNALKNTHFNLGISIDSIYKKPYELIRKNAHFEKSMENIDYFLKYAKMNKSLVTFSFCPIKQNIDEIHEWLKFATDRGALIYFNTVLEPLGDSLWSLSHRELSALIDKLKQQEIPTGSLTALKNKIQYENFIKLLTEWKNEAIERENLTLKLQTMPTEEILQSLEERWKGMFEKDLLLDETQRQSYLNSFIENIEGMVGHLNQGAKKEKLIQLHNIPVYFNIVNSDYFITDDFMGKLKKYIIID